jgi:cytidylate kinase
VTISRQLGSGAEQVARRICDLLGYDYLDKELMTQVAADVELSVAKVIDFSEGNYKVKSFLERLLRPGPRYVGHLVVREPHDGAETLDLKQLNETECINLIRAALRAAYRRDNMVIVGRGGQAVLKAMPKALHVRLVAPLRDRILRIQDKLHTTKAAARQLILERDQATAEYLQRFFGISWDDPLLYDLVINTARLGPDKAAQLIVDALRQL